jgi:hypothetical protein
MSHGISWAGLEDIIDSLVEDILKAVQRSQTTSQIRSFSQNL